MGQKKPGGQMSFPENPGASTCAVGETQEDVPQAEVSAAYSMEQKEGRDHVRMKETALP